MLLLFPNILLNTFFSEILNQRKKMNFKNTGNLGEENNRFVVFCIILTGFHTNLNLQKDVSLDFSDISYD
jgi:hypothetical protein